MTLTELGDFLRANPTAWKDIPEANKAVAHDALMPNPAFAEDQRYWFARWRLACTQADVDAINALLPTHLRVQAVTRDGILTLGSDLLTDSLDSSGNYYPAQSLIQSLVCVYGEPIVSPSGPLGV